MTILLITTGVLVVLGLLETLLHRRRLARIPCRIHVNGTRGKSSVTRLIAAGLRSGGKVVCAKTTGTLPRMIMPDGSEYPVYRPSGANIIEQLRIVSTAAAYRSEVLVVECMALQPYLQWLSEGRIIRATHGVITNARPDHLDVMGPTETDVAYALAGMTPTGGKLFTAEQDHIGVLASAAADRGSELIQVTGEAVEPVSEADMAGFSYVEHAENVALALRVCDALGVSREDALRGMWGASPDPGAMVDVEVEFFGRRFVFVNAFAANDPESTERAWRMAIDRHPEFERRLAVFNCRADRPERSLQLARAYADWPPASDVILMGTGTYVFAREVARTHQATTPVQFADGLAVPDVFERLVQFAGPAALMVGMGNIGGQGLELTQFFHNRSRIPERK